MNDREATEAMMLAQDAQARAIESGADPVDAVAEYDERVAAINAERVSDDLVTWLRAQLDDDERVARSASTFPYEEPTDAPWGRARAIAKAIDGSHAAMVHQHVARWDPARVLAEVDAKRRIIDEMVSAKEWADALQSLGKVAEADPYARQVGALLGAIRLLALPYADRPGYREEWRPST